MKSGARGGTTVVDSKVVPLSGEVKNQPVRFAPTDIEVTVPRVKKRSAKIPWAVLLLVKSPEVPPTELMITPALARAFNSVDISVTAAVNKPLLEVPAAYRKLVAIYISLDVFDVEH